MAERRKRKLKNLVVEEVSFVDRPANLRPFMFWKRNEPAAGVDLEKQFKSLKVEFDTDGTAEGTSLKVNGKAVTELMSFSVSSYKVGDNKVVPYCTYTQGAKGEANGGFKPSYTYSLATDEQAGPAVMAKNDPDPTPDTTDISKPYPSEHASRQNDPKRYGEMRRQNDKFGPGVHAIFGVLPNGKVEVQAIRFARDKFTPDEAKTWLKEHKYRETLEEAKAAPVKKSLDNADVQNVKDYLPDLPANLRGSVESLLGALEGPAAEEVSLEKEEEIIVTDDAAEKEVVDVKVVVSEQLATLRDGLVRDVTAGVLAAVRQAQTEADAAKAKADADTRAKVESGELREFPSETEMLAEMAIEASAEVLAEAEKP